MPARERNNAPTFPGLYAGRVISVDDPEGLGRIRVSVPSIFDEEDLEHSAWARPCFPYGHFYVPEVGDHVWVAFEHGEPSAPVWLGVWYPSGAVPGEADAKPPVKRVIRSPKGQLVILDDTDGEERVILQDKTGNRIELGTERVIIQCKQDLEIDASGKKVTIKAQRVDVNSA